MSNLDMASLGEQVLAELDRRDEAYYRWSILAFILSFLPLLIAYPPWLSSGQFYPSDYGNSVFHISILKAFNGLDPYIEGVYCVVTRILLGGVAKMYFWMVRWRDHVLNTRLHEPLGV